MEPIYKMVPNSTFEPVKTLANPYIEKSDKYCKQCGEANVIEVKDLNQFSPFTGNKMYSLYYLCSNGHEGKAFATVYRWKQDNSLYTGNFENAQDYIDQQHERRK